MTRNAVSNESEHLTFTWWPACRSAIAAERPPIPAPAIKIVKGAGSLVFEVEWPFGASCRMADGWALHLSVPVPFTIVLGMF